MKTQLPPEPTTGITLLTPEEAEFDQLIEDTRLLDHGNFDVRVSLSDALPEITMQWGRVWARTFAGNPIIG
ncbi:MAG TPA: hypothetical protein VGD59_05715 [Acidisarcina sp.]